MENGLKGDAGEGNNGVKVRTLTVQSGTDRGEDFCRLLNGGDAGPLPLLEELHPGGVVQGGRRVRSEEGGESLAVGQRRGAGAVGQLRGKHTRGRKRKEQFKRCAS